METFYRDNGNGLQDETGDIYGFVSNDYIGVDPYWSACNVRDSERDENGDYTFDNFDAQKLQNVAEKVLQLFYGHGNASYDYKHYGNDAEQDDIRICSLPGTPPWLPCASWRWNRLSCGT